MRTQVRHKVDLWQVEGSNGRKNDNHTSGKIGQVERKLSGSEERLNANHRSGKSEKHDPQMSGIAEVR